MLGLKTQESSEFLEFWKLVQKEAEKQDKIFYAECGEGNIHKTETMECEDMRGWLIPKEFSKKFEKEWKGNKVSDEWDDFIFWAEWSDEQGNIEVEFHTY